MPSENFYKKIFVAGAALFLLFAPAGFVPKGRPLSKKLTIAYALAQTQTTPPIETQTPIVDAPIPSVPAPTIPVTGTPVATTPPTTAGSPSALATASNQQPNFFTHPITGPVYYIAYVVDSIMSLAVMGTAALVRLGLQFNDNIFNSPAVQTGFSVSLAIANLGFVLGIIVIALATILRNQTYGIKQLLWKLVFMAILVNFGLVITAPIVGFAGSMTNYFINATSPGAATGGYEGYVETMAQAFAPQAVGSGVQGSGCTNATGGLAGICNVSQQSGTTADAFMKSFLALVFGIAFLAITAFTFLCLAILLVIRYLMLGGLLIVLPLAWLTWVFPKFDNSYSKWWNTFIKWTLFPPIALFFIYLAFITATNTTTPNTYLSKATQIPSGTQSVEGALAGQTGLGGPIQQAADEVLLVGLTIMGLMFANSLTGKAGSMVVNGATKASTALGGYVGKKTGRLALQGVDRSVAWASRKTGGSGAGLTQRLREGNVPGVGIIPYGRRMTAAVGRKVASVSTNEEMVKEAQKSVPKTWEEAKQNLNAPMSAQAQFAHLALGVKEGKLKADDMVNGQKVTDFLDGHQALIQRYGQGKLSSDADKLFMSDKKYRDAERAMNGAYEGAKKSGKSEEEALTAAYAAKVPTEEKVPDGHGSFVTIRGNKIATQVMDQSQKEMLEKFSKADGSKVDANALFGPAAQKSASALAQLEKRLKGIAEYAPQIVPNLVKGMNPPTLRSFSRKYDEALDGLIKEHQSKLSGLSGSVAEDTQAKLRQFTEAKKAFKQTIYKNVFGSADLPEGKGGEGGGEGKGGNDKK